MALSSSSCPVGSTVSKLTDGLMDHLDKSYCIVPHSFNFGEQQLRQRYQGTCVDGNDAFKNYDILKQCMANYYSYVDEIYTQSSILRAKQKDFLNRQVQNF